MQDTARLATIEQNIKNDKIFLATLEKLLSIIYRIFDNPQNDQLRTIENNLLTGLPCHDSFIDYLKYLGFVSEEDHYVFPKEQNLDKLKTAIDAIERKLLLCHKHKDNKQTSMEKRVPIKKKNVLKSVNVLKTDNSLLLTIQKLFNDVLKYEDEGLQELAKKHIPIDELQLMAMQRMREQQQKLKNGVIEGHDMPFEIAFLMELMGWFKHKFFSWVDKPECEACGGPTTLLRTETRNVEMEMCRVEIYTCTDCAATTDFCRYNSPRALLGARRGRCGEWANCFALLCRSLGYDTRYVYDTTDHVWCEVFDYDSNTWLHVDPCEGKLNAPLMYSVGWGKRLSYVIAFSKDDVQDVTWRYTMDHKQVLERRDECDEALLILSLMKLREARQAQVSDERRKYLAKRNLRELVMLMVERKPSDYESHGRISGSEEWRIQRGEFGTKSHTFDFLESGNHCIEYYPTIDKYRVLHNDKEVSSIEGWHCGVFETKNMFRKIENDWRNVYLARKEGEDRGTISWKLKICEQDLFFKKISIKVGTKVYENGNIDWTVKSDGEKTNFHFKDGAGEIDIACKEIQITAELSGGVGEVGWQHAQLFRQSLDDASPALQFNVAIGYA